MKNKMENYKEIIKDLEKRGIALLDLEICNEIEWQQDKELTEQQLELIYNTVERAYLKSVYITIEQLVRYCIKNVDKIYDMDVYDMAEWCCLAELGEISIKNGCMPVEVPDFTRGAWKKTDGFKYAFSDGTMR